jgi:hypothetical protein
MLASVRESAEIERLRSALRKAGVAGVEDFSRFEADVPELPGKGRWRDCEHRAFGVGKARLTVPESILASTPRRPAAGGKL